MMCMICVEFLFVILSTKVNKNNTTNTLSLTRL